MLIFNKKYKCQISEVKWSEIANQNLLAFFNSTHTDKSLHGELKEKSTVKASFSNMHSKGRVLRYQYTPKSTILPNFSYWYSQVHLIEFF